MYLGIDVHKRYAQVAVMDEAGEIVEEVRVENANLDDIAKQYAGSKAAIEATSNYYTIHDTLDEYLDVHHVVPRGWGGSNLMSNQVLLCRRCHDAAHEKRMAATVQSMSTGEMDAETFELFRRFWRDLVPMIGNLHNVPIEPIYRDEDGCWHVPEVDMKMLFGMIEGDSRGR